MTRLTPDPEKVKAPPCPRKSCGGKSKASFQADVGMDVSAGVAPGIVGSPAVRGYDIAMESAAHNAGLTNLNDKPRYGENSVPPLRSDLQAKVDGFWGSPAGAPKKTTTKRVDLSGMFGERATAAQKAAPMPGMTNVVPMSSPLPSTLVNRPGAGPPVQIEASWPPAS